MKRWILLGLAAVAITAAALAVGAGVFPGAATHAQGMGGPGRHGAGGPGMHGGMMKRMVSAALDTALDQANVTVEQRADPRLA